ncbi:MAG: magnesium transporter MgtE N-terminal domain-containing protein [Candidatus Scalindua sp.]
MIKVKLDIKKFIPYILFFIVFFSISSFVMIALKKGIEKKMGEYYSSKILELEEEYSKKESRQKEEIEQKKTTEAVRVLKGFSPDEIRKYQLELRQRIALYEKKFALLSKEEREIEAFKADVENRKKEMTTMRKELDGALLLISRERIDLDRDLIVFDESERKNLKRLADIYSSMDALKAAEVLNKLKNDTSAKILTGMQSKKSAKILSEFDPTVAAAISEKMKRLQIVKRGGGETLKERNIKKLAAIYQRIETKKAVSIMKKLEYETAISILSKMNKKNLAKIFEFVETDEASKLTEAIRAMMEKEFQKTSERIKGA